MYVWGREVFEIWVFLNAKNAEGRREAQRESFAVPGGLRV
jgi:hypothetical protein